MRDEELLQSSVCAHRRTASQRQSRSRGLLPLSSWFASSSPLVSSTASRHLSPTNVFVSKLLSLSISPYNILSFLSFFYVICLSTIPPFLLCVSDWQWHHRSVWRQGVLITSGMPGILCTVLHTFTWCQGNSDDLHTKLFFTLFFYSILLLLYSLVLSLDHLSFVIVMNALTLYLQFFLQAIKSVLCAGPSAFHIKTN